MSIRSMAMVATGGALLACLGIGSPTRTTLAAHPGSPALPHSCPSAAPARVISRYLQPAVGTSPLWAVAFDADGSLFLGDPRVVAPTAYGWPVKILWVLKPGFAQRVTLRGHAWGARTPLWFKVVRRDAHPVTATVLDPQHPGATGPVPGFPSTLYVPRPGCYVVDAHWPGGSWRLPFVARQ